MLYHFSVSIVNRWHLGVKQIMLLNFINKIKTRKTISFRQLQNPLGSTFFPYILLYLTLANENVSLKYTGKKKLKRRQISLLQQLQYTYSFQIIIN